MIAINNCHFLRYYRRFVISIIVVRCSLIAINMTYIWSVRNHRCPFIIIMSVCAIIGRSILFFYIIGLYCSQSLWFLCIYIIVGLFWPNLNYWSKIIRCTYLYTRLYLPTYRYTYNNMNRYICFKNYFVENRWETHSSPFSSYNYNLTNKVAKAHCRHIGY